MGSLEAQSSCYKNNSDNGITNKLISTIVIADRVERYLMITYATLSMNRKIILSKVHVL